MREELALHALAVLRHFSGWILKRWLKQTSAPLKSKCVSFPSSPFIRGLKPPVLWWPEGFDLNIFRLSFTVDTHSKNACTSLLLWGSQNYKSTFQMSMQQIHCKKQGKSQALGMCGMCLYVERVRCVWGVFSVTTPKNQCVGTRDWMFARAEGRTLKETQTDQPQRKWN